MNRAPRAVTKLAAFALLLLVTGLGPVRAAPLDGTPVPFFPKLTWGLSEQVALSQGLETYKSGDTKADVVGLPSVEIDGIDFAAQAVFGKKDVPDVRSGLNSIVLRHEGYVSKTKYAKFMRLITNGFLYAGKGSVVDETASFYNAVNGDNNLVVTNSDHAKTTLRITIAPGVPK